MSASENILGDAVLKLMRESITEQRVREIVREELARQPAIAAITEDRVREIAQEVADTIIPRQALAVEMRDEAYWERQEAIRTGLRSSLKSAQSGSEDDR